MAKVDIFALPIEWSDDACQDTFIDLDGQEVPYTIDRVTRLINNYMSGHNMLCGMDDCDMIPDPMAFLYGKQVLVPRCVVEGPTTPELIERNKKIDAEIEAKMRAEMPEMAEHMDQIKEVQTKRRLGFDIHRNG